MADSTNLSLGPNATLKLDRTVFDDEHHYRDVAVRHDVGRVSFRHRPFGQGRLQDHDAAGDHRRARHHARYPVAARPDHRQPAGRRGLGLHDQRSNASSSPSPATPPSSPRAAAAGRRSRRPTTRPGRLPQPAAPQQGFAARRNMRMRHPSSSMTAAIPPACCAGADHGKLHPQLTLSARAAAHARSRSCWRSVGAVASPTSLDDCVDCYPPTPTPAHTPTPTPLGFADHRSPSPTSAPARTRRPRPSPVRAPARSTTWPNSASTR